MATVPHPSTWTARLPQGMAARAVVALVTVGAVFASLGIPPALSSSPGTVDVGAPSALMVSATSDRALARHLEGARLSGDAYVFLGKTAETTRRVHFYLNDPYLRRAPFSTDEGAPYDLSGGDSAARALNTRTIPDGSHLLTVALEHANGGQQVLHTNILVDNSSATSTPEPEPVLRVRSGLHFTAAELAVWRQRAQTGPYRDAGDAGVNSPGDWTRVKNNAAAFLAAPNNDRWNGPSQNSGGCVPQWADEPKGGSRIRDAAFYYLITGDLAYRDAVKTELLSQAQTPGVNFANRNRWCLDVIGEINPGFAIAEWMTRHLFAYDYLGADNFTTNERAILDQWFREGAVFHQNDTDRPLERLFVDRNNGNYTPRSTDPRFGSSIGYYGSPKIGTIARHYNNRRAAQIAYVGLVGAHQNIPSYKTSAKLFVKEYLMFGVYPEGFTADFQRFTSTNPQGGWTYAANLAGNAITIADTLARTGDTDLYNFTTSTGLHGTAGGSKNLRFVMRQMSHYVDGTHKRHGTDQAANTTNAYLINGKHKDWTSIHDLVMIHGNRFYKDTYVHGVYTRTAANTDPYPSKPVNNGPSHVSEGPGGTYPAMLFMYGQMENAPTPY